MDRTQDEGLISSSARNGRTSVEQSTPRLQKKRSVKRVRSDAKRLTSKPESTPEPDEVSRQKSTSIRDAVKKIFGRRSRAPEVVPQPSSIQSTPLKHKAHRSEPPDVAKNTELPPRPNTADRATSIRESPTTRLRSPNAVEFPKSRQLKPLALPAPFEDPRSTLRRRKTLPSILIPDQDAKDIAAAIASAGPYPAASSFELARDPPVPSLGVTTKAARRRSRSVSDLREQLQAGPVRKRSDEIRFWRESIQTTVLRASGFSLPPDETVDSAVATTPPRLRKESTSTAQHRLSTHNSPAFDIRSASAYGTEISRDLEDRVAKLEANLNFFQRSLQKLQTDRSKRAGLAIPPRRDLTDRTPSMLVEDLQLPLAPSQYRYDIEPRPSTAPSRPARPDADAPPVPQIAPSPVPPLQPKAPTRPARPAESDAMQPSENATFRSLYRMLTDERSARRQLETQVRYMRTEISDLQNQVSAHGQSQRSSYVLTAPSDGGSARLRDLLGQLEAPQYQTPPRASEAIVSRFSGSTRQESDAEQTQEGAAYDSQRTPRPEQHPFEDQDFAPLDGPYAENYKLSSYRRQQDEGEMF